MPRNPFTYDKDAGPSQETEFGFGRGHFPNPAIDFSEGGAKSGIPVADPDRIEQARTLAEIRRLDVNDPNDKPSPFVAGNTDRYGAQPPLVRERNSPPRPRYTRGTKPRMERGW